jgi:hypothetical protein
MCRLSYIGYFWNASRALNIYIYYSSSCHTSFCAFKCCIVCKWCLCISYGTNVHFCRLIFVIFVGILDTESHKVNIQRIFLSQIKLEYDYYLLCHFSTFCSKCSCIELSLINNNYYYYYYMNFWTDPHMHKLPDYGLSMPNLCHMFFSLTYASTNVMILSDFQCYVNRQIFNSIHI